MQINISPSALKKLARIGPGDRKKIEKKIAKLETNPLLGKPLQGEYEGQYTLRAWPLRIIYTFNPRSKIIEIVTVDYRGSVYKK